MRKFIQIFFLLFRLRLSSFRSLPIFLHLEASTRREAVRENVNKTLVDREFDELANKEFSSTHIFFTDSYSRDTHLGSSSLDSSVVAWLRQATACVNSEDRRVAVVIHDLCLYLVIRYSRGRFVEWKDWQEREVKLRNKLKTRKELFTIFKSYERKSWFPPFFDFWWESGGETNLIYILPMPNNASSVQIERILSSLQLIMFLFW